MATKILSEVEHSFFAAAFEAADINAQELFGDSDECTDAEAEIIFSTVLTHAEKRTALQILRGSADSRTSAVAENN